MNIGADFHDFDFKRAFWNFLQVFLIGWFVFVVLLFIWSATSQYGFDKTVQDFSISLIVSPIFWFVPLMVALPISIARGVTRNDFDVTDEAQLERHFESQRFKNQPVWFKRFLFSMAAIFALSLMIPESEINPEKHDLIQKQLAERKSKELNALYAQITSDGKIMSSEFGDFRNKLFTTDMNKHLDK